MDAERARLGLAERPVRLLSGRDIWASITPLLTPRRNLVAAFGHVGPGAAALLPLEPGDTIITDASGEAVRSGATSPHALLHWVKAGVTVHSLPGLHAKLVIAEDDPAFVVVGSADLSAAAPQLFETAVLTDEKHTVEDAQEAWLEWCDQAGPALTAGDLEPLLEQYAADRATVTRPTPPARPAPVAAPRPAPVAPAAPPKPAPVTPAPQPASVQPTPPPPPEPEPEPVATPAVVTEPEPEPEASEAPEVAEAPEAPESDTPRPSWPRPAELYLVSLVEGGEPSAEAEYKLEELAREHTHPGEGGESPFKVELFWADDGQGQDPPRTLRPGVHVIRVYSQKQGRALVGSQIEAPGLVLHAYTDEYAYPRRTYAYLLTRTSSATPAFGDLRKALATIGEKPNFRNSFQIPRKIEALLGLWPDLGYDPR